MSNPSVLDASAILAYLQEEAGQDHVEAAFDAGECWLSAVNLSEILGKLADKGMPLDEAQETISELGLFIKDFNAESAAGAAALKSKTAAIGASLGDRACLALAQQAVGEKLSPVVVTAERAWSKVNWPFKLIVIR